MYLINDEALICKTSREIMLFKIQTYTDPDTEEKKRKWMTDCVLDSTGLISYAVGNLRIQVTSPSTIYFYIFDKKEMKPVLENLMPNNKKCT